jgi:stearoyl-CoA desaturase (Delta-9 desaturase)
MELLIGESIVKNKMNSNLNISLVTLIFGITTYSLGLLSILVIPWSDLTLNFYIFTVFYFTMGMIGGTLGLHRYFCHRSFDTGLLGRWILFLLGSSLFPGSFLEWIRDHQMHHKHLNTDFDHSNRNRGLLYSHFGWGFIKNKCIDPLEINDSLLLHFHYYHIPYSILTSILIPIIIGSFLSSFYTATLVCYALRLTIQQNLVFSLSSFCHRTDRSNKETSINNLFLAIPTFGDSYQMFHHENPKDYRHGYRYYDVDINKWLIILFAKLGLFWNLQSRDTSDLPDTSF